jgi:16S rRNA (adenine1518-N6/adenine1519-N6)-dimethyltransferase
VKPADILRELGKFPQKRFGQNFLVDEEVLAQILAAGAVEPDETVVEIGPGLGVLTYELIKRANRVIAIEADRDLAEYLRKKNIPKLTVVTGDALQIDWTVALVSQKAGGKRQKLGVAEATAINISEDSSTSLEVPSADSVKYKIIANIPYSITSPLLTKIYQLEKKPAKVVLLVQKEVAERLSAKPGDRERGFMTMTTEANASVRIVCTVLPSSFYPEPTVDSAVIELVPYKKSRVAELFWPAVEAGFRHKRQNILNGLNSLPLGKDQITSVLDSVGLDRNLRPADLTFEQWVAVGGQLKELIRK